MFKLRKFWLEPTSIRSRLLMSWPWLSDVLAAARQLERARLKFNLTGSNTPPTRVSGNNIAIYIGPGVDDVTWKISRFERRAKRNMCACNYKADNNIRFNLGVHNTIIEALKLIQSFTLLWSRINIIGGKAELIAPSAGQNSVVRLLLFCLLNKYANRHDFYYSYKFCYSYNSRTSLKPNY